jgi:cobalt-zinc-cadmium efflux system outer membrane protein
VGLTFAVPLLDGGRQDAQASQLRATAAELDARAREVQAARDAEDARAEADRASAEGRLAIAEELVEACETRLRQAEERYDLGAGSIEPIAEARTVLLRARSEVVLARVDRAGALLRLAR